MFICVPGVSMHHQPRSMVVACHRTEPGHRLWSKAHSLAARRAGPLAASAESAGWENDGCWHIAPAPGQEWLCHALHQMQVLVPRACQTTLNRSHRGGRPLLPPVMSPRPVQLSGSQWVHVYVTPVCACPSFSVAYVFLHVDLQITES